MQITMNFSRDSLRCTLALSNSLQCGLNHSVFNLYNKFLFSYLEIHIMLTIGFNLFMRYERNALHFNPDSFCCLECKYFSSMIVVF